MIRPARAVAFAAAAFLGLFAIEATPLLASPDGAAKQAAHFLDHGEAFAEAGDLALNAGGTGAAADTPAFGHAESLAGQERRSLADLVDDHGGATSLNAEQHCLASAIYFEARGESLEGQLAVAEVVLNRTRSGRYPATICAVVRQPAQFSFVRRGVIPRADAGSEAWRRAVAIARIAETRATRLLPDNVLWYHANYVAPGWGRRLERNTRIGLHIFYS